MDGWVWLKLGVGESFGSVHMCAKSQSHWMYLASTCFTRYLAGQKLDLEGDLTWMVGFG